MELKDYNHSYYCSDSNYYSNDTFMEFDSWEHFTGEFGLDDTDIDMNLIFRWDLIEYTKEDVEDGDYVGFVLKVYMMHQRKGIFRPMLIKGINESDIPEIENYLLVHWNYLTKLWNPISRKA